MEVTKLYKCIGFGAVLAQPSQGPGEGPDCHFPGANRACWTDCGPDPGGDLLLTYILALRAVRV